MHRHLAAAALLCASAAHALAQVPVWELQLPEQQPAWRDVHMLSAVDGWIAGGDGRLLHTTNGGVSFLETQVPSADLRAVFFLTASRGWAVGDGLFRTSDAGTTWTKTTSGTLLQDVQFVGPTTGWIAGAGQVCRTSDGTSFTCAALPTAEVLDLHFADALHGWAVGRGGLVAATSDGGQTWTQQASGTSADLTAVEFDGLQDGWIAAGDAVLRTGDGGATWQPVPLPLGVRAQDLDVLAGTFVWIAGEAGRIAASSDGGQTWSVQLAAGGADLLAIGMGDLTHGFAAGVDGTIWRTQDGASWQQVAGGAASPVPYVFGLDALDAQTAWAAVSYGDMLRTTDGGATWQASPAGPQTLYRAVDFADALNGYACGEKQGFYPTVAWTHDGGANWSVTNFVMMVEFYDVAALDAQTALVVGETFVWRTTNGGLSWPSVTPLPYGTFHAVDFVDASTGWIVGTKFFKSTDGGQSWTLQIDPPETYFDVGFADASTGWAVGQAGRILKTTDGGATWTPQSAGSGVPNLLQVQVLDAMNLWIGGEGGYVARSSDGGATWQREQLPTVATGAAVRAMAFVQPDAGWVSGGPDLGIWRFGLGDAPCAVQGFCQGKPHSQGGVASLGGVNLPSVGSDAFAVSVAGGLPGALGVLVHSLQGANAAPFQGGTLCVLPPLVRNPPLVLDAAGAATAPIPLGGGAAQPGETRWYQLWYRDPAVPDGTAVALSDGLMVRICD